MALLTVRDYSSSFEVAVFPKTFEKIKNSLALDTPLVFKGMVSSRNGDKSFAVDEVKKMETE